MQIFILFTYCKLTDPESKNENTLACRGFLCYTDINIRALEGTENMKLNIAICDDEQNQIEYLKEILQTWLGRTRHIAEISAFPSAEAFLFEYSENQNFDVLLLDIEMSGMNGVELARKLRKQTDALQIIFVTGYDEYISDGYDVAALHYLMKPVKKEKLFSVLDRAVENLGHKEESLVLETENGVLRVNFSEIMLAEAKGHDTVLTLASGKETAKIGINDLEKKLDTSFVRSHRSYLVGLRHITRITKTDVILDNGALIPLSRRMYAVVNQKFIGFYKRHSVT